MSQPHSTITGLRIVQLTTLGISAKSFLVEHFKLLRSSGAEVTLVCSDDADGKAASQAADTQYIPVNIKQHIAPLSDLISLLKLWRLFRTLRPNVVHAHMTKAGLLGIIASGMSGVQVRIYHNHGLTLTSAQGLRRILLLATEWLTNRFATHVLFCSESTRTAAIESGVAVAERSQVLGSGTISGVDVEKFTPDRTGRVRHDQRLAWCVNEDTVVVGYVGRLVAHKGIEALIDAWRLLDVAVRDRCCLLLVGGNAHSESRILAIVNDALRDNIGVKTIGWIEDMVGCYSGMDMLVMPSWREGFPYGIVEAQSMELPIVTTHATGNVDAVQHENTGLLVPIKNPVALAGALSRLISSPNERKRLGEHGRQRIIAEFTQGKVLQDMLTFYEEQVAPMAKR